MVLKYLQKFLGKLGEIEYNHFYAVLIFIFIVSGFAFVGLTKVEFESDFSKFDPKGIPIVDLDKRVREEFPSFSAFLVIVQLDDDRKSNIVDIRDPKVMEFLIELNKALGEETKIQEVRSAGLVFQEIGVPQDLESSKAIFNQIPGSDGFFNKQYSMTPVFISVDVSGDSSKINEMNEKVRKIVESTSKPNGIKVSVTGEPPLLARIFDLMIQDGIFTLFLATIAIFLMLLLIQRSFLDGIVIILPVLFGVIWTIGGMGWFGIPITVATAAIGAMLLGLGVEYSIFLNSRYKEEKEKLTNKKIEIKNALVTALSTTGASTFSSGITTMIGFFALSLSVFPMLADLGFSLGMGIALILSAVMVVGPMMIIIRDRHILKNKRKIKKKKQQESGLSKSFEVYGKFVSKRTGFVIIVALIITGVMFYGGNFVENEEIDFDTILPDDLEELKAFNLMQDEFGDSFSILYFLELDPDYTGSDEPIDIRDPRIIKYSDILAEKSRHISYVQSVDSLSFLVKEANNGFIPGSLTEQKELLENMEVRNYLTEDFSGMVIRIRFDEDVFRFREEIVNQVNNIVEETEGVAGVSSYVLGGVVVQQELDKVIGPDSSKTALIAFGIIIVFLFLLSRSIKYTVLPLVTVVVAIVWIMGMIGYFKVGWNSIISSVISMTIGIGIDFGIQLSNRFRQELEEIGDKRKAMCRTLKYTLYPMIITVAAALIGFQAMNLGQLKLMGDLGKTMSFGMVASMIVAVSLVAGLMVIFEKDKSLKSKKTGDIMRGVQPLRAANSGKNKNEK